MVSTLDDIDVYQKTVLVQSNLDVPIEHGNITDNTRLQKSLQTIKELLHKKARVLICGHIGRPNGEYVPELSTRQLVNPLSEMLQTPITFISHLHKDEVEKVAIPGVGLLENIRMWPGEEATDQEFAKHLAQLADVFVNDDYIDSHRSGAVNTLVPKLLTSAMGRTLAEEYERIQETTTNPKHPYVVIIGGAKTDKLSVIRHVLPKADYVLVGGVLANTFLASQGVNVQQSKYDPKGVQEAKELFEHAQGKIILPRDCVAASEFKEHATHTTCYVNEIPQDSMVLDIGPQTIRQYKKLILEAKTIIWGGPIGAFELHPFDHGTQEIAQALASSNGYSLVAGGDSSAAIHQLELTQNINHVSIGGGATLHLIAGEKLPAIESLKNTSE